MFVKKLYGAKVCIKVQHEAGAKQNVGSVFVAWDARISEWPHENRVISSKLIVSIGRNGNAGLQILVGAVVKLHKLEYAAGNLCAGIHDFNRFRCYFFADAVTGYNCYPFVCHR